MNYTVSDFARVAGDRESWTQEGRQEALRRVLESPDFDPGHPLPSASTLAGQLRKSGMPHLAQRIEHLGLLGLRNLGLWFSRDSEAVVKAIADLEKARIKQGESKWQ